MRSEPDGKKIRLKCLKFWDPNQGKKSITKYGHSHENIILSENFGHFLPFICLEFPEKNKPENLKLTNMFGWPPKEFFWAKCGRNVGKCRKMRKNAENAEKCGKMRSAIYPTPCLQ
jgi:hypothetical protein